MTGPRGVGGALAPPHMPQHAKDVFNGRSCSKFAVSAAAELRLDSVCSGAARRLRLCGGASEATASERARRPCQCLLQRLRGVGSCRTNRLQGSPQ